MNTANARFAIKTWDEKPYSETPGEPKLTRASVTKTFSGDVEGDGQVEYLMMYRSDGSASFVGLERVVGRNDGDRLRQACRWIQVRGHNKNLFRILLRDGDVRRL